MDRLLLDERIRGDGSVARSWASCTGSRFALADDDGTAGALSIAALDRVMCRYGRPLEPDIALAGDALELPDGRRLSRLRYHAAVDAIARDYLVWQRPGEPPLAVLATHATAALRYLVARLSDTKPVES